MSITTNDDVLIRTNASGIATLTLNRPEARNALSTGLMAALQTELDGISSDRDIRVVVIAANGPAFCAGHDLREVRSAPQREAYEALFAQCSKLMLSITRLPQPVIAKVHATATAAGCQLVATCDLAIAAETAKFATPGVNIGLFCSTPMVAVSRNVGRKRMMEMLLTGEMMDAENRGRRRPNQQHLPTRRAQRRGCRPLRHHLVEIGTDPESRKGSVLPPARNAAGRRIRICERGNGDEHVGT